MNACTGKIYLATSIIAATYNTIHWYVYNLYIISYSYHSVSCEVAVSDWSWKYACTLVLSNYHVLVVL